METTDRKGTERSAQVWQEEIDSKRPEYNQEAVMWINGLMFERVEPTLEKSPLIRGRMVFLIEDIHDGEVHVASYWQRGQGIRSIFLGHIGVAFHRKYGKHHLPNIRVWMAVQKSPSFGKYQVETYLLARLANKRSRDARLLLTRRKYESLSPADKAKWCDTYPNTVRYVVEGHAFESP